MAHLSVVNDRGAQTDQQARNPVEIGTVLQKRSRRLMGIHTLACGFSIGQGEQVTSCV